LTDLINWFGEVSVTELVCGSDQIPNWASTTDHLKAYVQCS